MNKPFDPYEVLGIKRDASLQEIKRAYRKHSNRTHPDKHPDNPDAAKKFKAISDAFELLSDPAKRKLYDETGETDNEAVNEMVRQLALGAFERECDPVTWMRETLKSNIADHERNGKDMERKLGKLRSKLSIFMATNPDPSESSSIIQETIEQKISGLNESIATAKACVDLNKACQTYIAGLKEQPRQPFGTRTMEQLMMEHSRRRGSLACGLSAIT